MGGKANRVRHLHVQRPEFLRQHRDHRIGGTGFRRVALERAVERLDLEHLSLLWGKCLAESAATPAKFRNNRPCQGVLMLRRLRRGVSLLA